VRGAHFGGKVVDWAEDGSATVPGPNAAHYEHARKSCGAHLLFNAFWAINHFCVHQMLMKDPMHAIDLGVIVTLIKAILRKYYECVENKLGFLGRAATKLQARFNNMLSARTGPDGQRCVYTSM